MLRTGCASETSHRPDQGHDPEEPFSKLAKPVRLRNPQTFARLLWHGRSSEQELSEQGYVWGHWKSFKRGIWGSLGNRDPSRGRNSVGVDPVWALL